MSSSYINHFLQPDSIIPDPANPQAWNRYSYVANNPINFNDPTGHAMKEDDGGGDCDLECLEKDRSNDDPPLPENLKDGLAYIKAHPDYFGPNGPAYYGYGELVWGSDTFMLELLLSQNPSEIDAYFARGRQDYSLWQAENERRQESDERWNHGIFDYYTGQVCLFIVCSSVTVDKFGRWYYNIPSVSNPLLALSQSRKSSIIGVSLMATEGFSSKSEVYSTITSPSGNICATLGLSRCVSSDLSANLSESIGFAIAPPGFGVGVDPSGSVPFTPPWVP